MHPSASILNITRSIEKFLFDGMCTDNTLLIHKPDYTARLKELETAEKGFLWDIHSGVSNRHGSIQLFIGATTIKDPGSINRLTLQDTIKGLLESTGSIPVYDYLDDAKPIVNQLVLVDPIRTWPILREPNGFQTIMQSTTLKFGQITT